MRKTVLFAAVLLLFVAALVSAQRWPTSEFYPKSLRVSKIYSHTEGYKLVYEKNNRQLGVMYIPIEWFYEAGGKAEIVYGYDEAYPYITIFYRNGEFHHLRLYVRKMPHPSWGVLVATRDISDLFDVDQPEVEYQ